MTVKPLGDRVLIKRLEAEEKTKGGIILTSAAKEQPQMAQVLAVGPDGLYELVGDTDDGAPIAAELVGGFTDFRRPHQKRLDSMYFGYTSAGVLSVTPEVLESGYPPIEYELEQRSATAPRNTRVRPGKGLFGRYWRVTFRNKDGTSFTVHDITADIAVSARRL